MSCRATSRQRTVIQLTAFIAVAAAIASSCTGEGSRGEPGPIGQRGTPGEPGEQGPQGREGPQGAFAGTFSGNASFTGKGEFDGGLGVNLSDRVTKTAPMSGTQFATDTIAGTNVCAMSYSPCNAWQAMVLDTLSSAPLFNEPGGWVVGSFPNLDEHLRSLANGQNSVVCPPGNYLMKYPSVFVHGGITTQGGVHCTAAAAMAPVYCCKERGL